MRFIQFILIFLFAAGLNAQALVNQTDAKGRKQGLWRKNYPDGIIRYEGSFKDDQPDGIFRYYTELGKLKMVAFHYDNGKRSRVKGFSEKGGIISSGNYIGKEKDSVWTYFDENNVLLSREPWQNGMKHGVEYTYYPNGNLSEEIGWKNGRKDGPWKQYFEDGKPRLTASHKEGNRVGKQTYFYANGNVKLMGMYVNDLREGTWIHYEENGALKHTEIYKNGVSDNPLKIQSDKPANPIPEPSEQMQR
ncbi:MAG: toxin-antitoxin system YwqK family antitoxin [Bacteroidia bacterium]|jgi:antitoxin component YwqK of YwqJK toxin-antitoxin module